MRLQISYKKFLNATSELIEPSLYDKVVSFVLENGRNIEASNFIRFLRSIGLDRPSIVCYLREMDIDDYTIVSTYDCA